MKFVVIAMAIIEVIARKKIVVIVKVKELEIIG